MRLSSLGLVLLVVAVCVPASALAQTWNLQTVDNAGDVGYNSRIAVTSDGTPYILYVATGEIRLAWWVSSGNDGGGWTTLVVAGNPITSYRSLALRADAYDELHMAWGEYTGITFSDCRLKYRVFDTTTKDWDLDEENVEISASEYVHYLPDLAIADSSGTITPTIVYGEFELFYDQTRILKYATRDPGTGIWSNGVIDDVHRIGLQVSVAVDSSGGLHVSYYEETADDLMYATKAAGDTTWARSYVDIVDQVGMYSSIIVDDQDRPYIVYYDETNGDLKYAKWISE